MKRLPRSQQYVRCTKCGRRTSVLVARLIGGRWYGPTCYYLEVARLDKMKG